MPFPPQIRKKILVALERYIIPALQDSVVPQIIAEPPFDFGGLESKIVQEEWLEDKALAPLQSIIQWRKQCVMATRFLRIMMVYHRRCVTRIGITQSTAALMGAAQRETLGGVNELTVNAPTIICNPPYTVHSSSEPRPGFVEMSQGIIYCGITETDVRISLNVKTANSVLSTHHLEINDGELIRTASLYAESLRTRKLQRGQSLALAFMQRLHANLLLNRARLSNSSWITPPEILPEVAKVLSPVKLQLCQNVTDYIVSHLHADLSLVNLAQRFGVSTVYLNAVFKQARGITVMRFVRQMRLEVAKNMLTHTPERINDVAQLLGFASDTSFCTVFQRQFGQSPGEYRKNMQKKHSVQS